MKTSIVILAAGLGTRMKSKTAKVLHKAGGLTLIENVLRVAMEVADAGDICVVVGHQADAVRAVVEPLGVKTALQAEQKGTGHAVAMAREALAGAGGLLVVLYGDAPMLKGSTVKELVRTHIESGKAATVLTCEMDDPSGYGRIIRDADGNVSAIVEHKAASEEQRKIREINSGIYCFNADLVWNNLSAIGTNNPAGEYYLTDIVEILNQQGKKCAPMVIADASELAGINTRVELSEADEILRARKTRALMLGGVTIEKPDTVIVDADVVVGQDTTIEAYTRLLGKTVIGEDCVIGSGSVISNSTLADRVLVGSFTSIADSTIGAGAHVGPFARLRMKNEVADGVHIGNFVELKNTKMGVGAKANHLAYLGDSSIGSKSNIGAGTITCNYDGEKKHRTEIGSGAFVGSNSTLVAPVAIGDKAYVAAGSVITESVPAETLALGRARQVTKEGWKPRSKRT